MGRTKAIPGSSFLKGPIGALSGIGLACAVAISWPIILEVVSCSAAYADESKPAALRPEIAKPVQEAQRALVAKKYNEALARLKEADEVANKTPYEEAIVEQLRLIAAIGAQEPATAAKAFDALRAGGSLDLNQQIKFTQAIAKAYREAKDYQAAATWIERYFSAGGADLSMRSLLAQSYFQNNDFANCTKSSNEAISAFEKAGQRPPETLYQLLTTCATKQNDKSAYVAALERLTGAYPKPENWAALLHQVVTKPGFPDTRLGLDIFRLQAATGGLTKADQYIEFAEIAMQAGLPAEAKAVLDKGYAAGVLGTGPEADRHGRLRDMAKHELEANQAGLANAEAEAGKQPTGSALVAAGINDYGYGQYDKAINLIQAGIAKGGLANPDDAKLHLGIVELAGGKEGQGVATLKSITSGNAVNDIARLWLIKTTGHQQ
jgi:tetratricopeptide (TPR) repeat protein